MSIDGNSSEGGPKGSFENFKAEADVLFKQNDYKKAIDSYNTVCSLYVLHICLYQQWPDQ
jgi:hypothetical protein